MWTSFSWSKLETGEKSAIYTDPFLHRVITGLELEGEVRFGVPRVTDFFAIFEIFESLRVFVDAMRCENWILRPLSERILHNGYFEAACVLCVFSYGMKKKTLGNRKTIIHRNRSPAIKS